MKLDAAADHEPGEGQQVHGGPAGGRAAGLSPGAQQVLDLGGGGLSASVDGPRFVVPVRTVNAGPSPEYFGYKRGITWLNAVNDQIAGIGRMVVPGTPRDSLYILDVLLNLDAGPRPDFVTTDHGSYSDTVHGVSAMPGHRFSPRYADDDGYLRRVNRQPTVQESRRRPARKICHRERGQIRQKYREGQEDRLAALGLVVNAVVLWNSRYLDAAVSRLRARGLPVHDEDVARLSPPGHAHVNCPGRYAFAPTVAGGALRPLREPQPDDEDE